MRIHFSPQVSDEVLTLAKSGDVLTINGEPFDFGPLTEGAVLPVDAVDCSYVINDVTRVDGRVVLTLLLPIAWDAPPEAAFPESIEPDDGPISLPGARE